MSAPVGKFRKKPVVVEAIQWDGSFESALVILKWSGAKVYYREYAEEVVEK